MASQFSAEAFAENGEFQKEATALSYQAELMNSLSNDITDLSSLLRNKKEMKFKHLLIR